MRNTETYNGNKDVLCNWALCCGGRMEKHFNKATYHGNKYVLSNWALCCGGRMGKQQLITLTESYMLIGCAAMEPTIVLLIAK